MSSEERTAFLADNEHTGSDEHHEGSLVLQKLPANAHFKRPLRILTSITALLSILILGLLIAILVILKTGRFTWNYSAIDAVKGGIIVLFINAILNIPAIFIQLPILLNIARDIAMSIVVLVFTPPLFDTGSMSCRRYQQYPSPPPPPGTPWRPIVLPPYRECVHAERLLNIMMPIAASFGILIGVLILVTLVLRVFALFRTRFWAGWAGKAKKSSGWNGSGFTVQFSFSIVPYSATQAVASGGREGQLIET